MDFVFLTQRTQRLTQRYAEDKLTGSKRFKGRVVVVVHTECDRHIRIISMRKATKYEERTYFEQIAN
ncbi:MAG: BrnT family toxin [Aphanothece sp. CMT-3BRIN-NPC111]|nr:BrnT family toxin [Aphanothece sp. CMT-3BRIN-NPC111]